MKEDQIKNNNDQEWILVVPQILSCSQLNSELQ